MTSGIILGGAARDDDDVLLTELAEIPETLGLEAEELEMMVAGRAT